MTRDGFMFYRSYRNAIRKLNDEDRLAAYDALTDFCLDGTEPDGGVAAAIVEAFRLVIEANNRKHENGLLGGRPKSENQTITKQKPNDNQTETNPEPTDNLKREKRKEKREVINNKKSERRFEPPTHSQVTEYCRERRNNVDPDRFVDFYESKGWKVGNQPMKDWKAAVRAWERNSAGTAQRARAPSFSNQRTYDSDDLERRLLSLGSG